MRKFRTHKIADKEYVVYNQVLGCFYTLRKPELTLTYKLALSMANRFNTVGSRETSFFGEQVLRYQPKQERDDD